MLSVALFVDRVERPAAAPAAKSPAVCFRLPSYSPVLIRPAPNRLVSQSSLSISFARGKSCLLHWPPGTTVTTLRLEMYLIDLVEAPDPRPPPPIERPPGQSAGRGILMGTAVHELRLRERAPEAFTRIRLEVVDLVGNNVATVHARCRCQRLGMTMVPHMMQNLAQQTGPRAQAPELSSTGPAEAAAARGVVPPDAGSPPSQLDGALAGGAGSSQWLPGQGTAAVAHAAATHGAAVDPAMPAADGEG